MRMHAHRGTCPLCGTSIECVSAPGAAPPHTGDLNVCSECAGLLRFGDDLHLVPMTDEDLAVLDVETRDTLLETRSFIIQSHRGPLLFTLTTVS